jgi:hypothetical protein
MGSLRHFFRRPPKSRKGIREQSAVVGSAEIAGPAFPRPVSGEEARAALERSRARRAAANGGAA